MPDGITMSLIFYVPIILIFILTEERTKRLICSFWQLNRDGDLYARIWSKKLEPRIVTVRLPPCLSTRPKR